LSEFAKRDLSFAQGVHNKITELVKLAKAVSLNQALSYQKSINIFAFGLTAKLSPKA
jgi:hypothetical protein